MTESIIDEYNRLVSGHGLVAWLEKVAAMAKEMDTLRGWNPIETAPKNGTDILLAKIAPTKVYLEYEARPPFVWWCVKGYWSSKWQNWNDGVEPSGLADPNYWATLPEVPDELIKAYKASLVEPT